MTFPCLSFSFLFFAFVFVTHAFDLSLIQMEVEQRTCPYTVVIMTSCLSPESTRDQISIVFGDADGNKVYAPQLGGSVRGSPGKLGKCSTDTFQVKGQCLNNPICSLYINRTGPDGWVPESIEIYSEGSKSVKFDFSKSDLHDTWYGHNNCSTTGRPSSPDLPPPESPPVTPAFPPPPPPPRHSAASKLGDGVSAFIGFVIPTAIAISAMVVA